MTENPSAQVWVFDPDRRIHPDELRQFTGEVVYKRWSLYGRPDLVPAWADLPETEQVRWSALSRWAETVNLPVIDVNEKYGEHLRKINPNPELAEAAYDDETIAEEAAQFFDLEKSRFES
jgi:hypothetical protein